MAASPGCRSPDIGRAGCRTPGMQGRNQASPFSKFAADLSPITPTKGGAFDSAWQPPVVSPSGGSARLGGKEMRRKQTANGPAAPHSGDNSSLRSSYEAESTTFSNFYVKGTGTSPTRQYMPNGGSILAVDSASIPENSAAEQSEPAGHKYSKGGARTNSGTDRTAGMATQTAQGTKGGPAPVTLTDAYQSSNSRAPTQLDPSPTSPFAAMASKQPPQEWQTEENEQQIQGIKRKAQGSESEARQRRRMLTFGSGAPAPTSQPLAPATHTLTAHPNAQAASSVGNHGRAAAPVSVGPPPVSRPLPSSAAAIQLETAHLQNRTSDGACMDRPLAVSFPPSHTQSLTSMLGIASLPPGSLIPPPSLPAEPGKGPLLYPPNLSVGPPQNHVASALAAAVAAGPIKPANPSAIHGAALAAASAAAPIQRRQAAAPQGAIAGAPPKRACMPKERKTQRDQAAAGQKKCNCKKSRCLKLYCDCFAAGQYCTNCTCTSCSNTAECRDAVMESRDTILARDPAAFSKNVLQRVETAGGSVNQHKRGCHCKKSGCKKKYCECYQAGVNCGQHCKCEHCQNQPEHGLPELKSKGPARGRTDPTNKILEPAKPEMGLPPPEPRRTSCRPRKKTPAKSGLAAEDAFLDEETQYRRCPAPAGALAEQTAPYSPPTLVWESQILYQGDGMTLFDQKDLEAQVPMPELEPKAGGATGPSRPTPVRATQSALPPHVMDEQGKDKLLSHSRFSPGTMPLPGDGYRNLKTAENLGNLLKGRDEPVVMMARSPGPQRSGLPPEDVLTGWQEPAQEAAYRMVPLNGTAVQQSNFLAELQSFDLPSYGTTKSVDPHSDDFRSQVLPASYFQLAEQFNIAGDDVMDASGPLAGATPWTEKRMDDLDAGEGMQASLESLMMGGSGGSGHLGEHNFLLPTELENDAHGHDENCAPLPPLQERFGNSSLARFPSPGPCHLPSPASQQTKARFPGMSFDRIMSPSRDPFCQIHQEASNLALPVSEPEAAAAIPCLENAPSLNPATGIPALKEHRPALPAMPQTTLERARSGEIFQAVLDDALQGVEFEDHFSQDDSHEPLASFGHHLEHANSMPSCGSLGLPPQQKSQQNSPLGRTFSVPQTSHLSSSHGGFNRAADAAPFKTNRVREPALKPPSPQKSRFLRPSGPKQGNAGFYRLTAGSTTIFSPPKSC